MQFTQNKWIREYFTFSQKERRAVILLAVAAVLFALLPTMFPFLVKDEMELVIDTSTENQLAQLKIIPERNEYRKNEEQNDQLYEPKYASANRYTKDEPAGELFYFNPNTASAEEWQRLGLREKTIKTILNYRNKGGKFYKPEDIKRIYGLREAEVERLLPFVQIERVPGSKHEAAGFSKAVSEKKPGATESKSFVIDINTADTTEWKKLYGIGSKLSQRIINFRTKLGGFATVEQVGETFGLPDSTFQAIKPKLMVKSSSIKQINLNNATLDELKSHPYIKYAIANAIIQYRTEHGQFKAVADLQKLGAIDELLLRKIAPYLTVE
ncbi:MAG: helix-hairpin-helix domain-containing protein [Lacibacter sp.]